MAFSYEKSNINLLENYILLLQGKQTKANTKFSKSSFRHILTDIPTLFRYKKLGIYRSIKLPNSICCMVKIRYKADVI